MIKSNHSLSVPKCLSVSLRGGHFFDGNFIWYGDGDDGDYSDEWYDDDHEGGGGGG